MPRHLLQLHSTLSQQFSQSLRCLPGWVIALTLWSHAVWQKLRPQPSTDTLPQITDRSHQLRRALSEEDDTFRHIAFTFAVIALSARIACAEGPLTKEKYIAFRESFPLGGGICGKIRQLFTLACTDQTPTEHYINQLKYMYPDKAELFTSVVERLYRIATADGVVGRKAEMLLAEIAASLSLTPEGLAHIRIAHEQATHAHVILGVTPETSSSTLKKRYHELMRLYHPDRFGTEALSDEIRLLLRAKTSEINSAYRTLSKKAA